MFLEIVLGVPPLQDIAYLGDNTYPSLVYLGWFFSGEIFQGVTPFQAVAPLWYNNFLPLAQVSFSFIFEDMYFFGFI